MALLPNTIIYGTTGNNSSPTEKANGGTLLGVTSTTDTTNGPITRTFVVRDNAMGDVVRRSVPLERASGTGHTFNTKKAYTSGTFAYEQVDWIVRQMATTINGVANTAIRLTGNESNRVHRLVSNKGKGAKTATAYRAGYWRPTGIVNKRINWSTAPSTANVSYVLPTNNSSAADDQAIYVTYRSVPGELVYMQGSTTPKQDDYKAITNG